ncbi:MAG TPA: histidine--tRNA ligase [Firmicutes bacterium]|jgi:histidyl-tRNA synthetase|nr:histidine--tRNA ligase [Bacillota bacterium]HAA34617.1 histidine--tRNA ligase [Bacillota bacterium]
MSIKAPRGTRDILPLEAQKWYILEEIFKKMCCIYNMHEIRTPLFEETELFVRSVGEESDVVNKEMYNFKDRGGRELALRPEGTAGVVRAYIEHGLYNMPQPVKLFYYGPMFRYDRPQAGRQRQFYQMGIEIFGTREPIADVEVIKFTADFFSSLGFRNLQLHINSVGCPQCRFPYQDDLKEFAREKLSMLCADCQRRALLNPLRLLDCKEEGCRELMKDSPQLESYLCQDCRDHFNGVLELLNVLNVPYYVDPYMVRGLDYYTNTAFEFISEDIGAQGSLGGGGRYDNLVEICGGPSVPGVGLAMGVERIALAMDREQLWPEESEPEGVFMAVQDSGLKEEALSMLYSLREKGLRADTDFLNRSLKAQMKFANRNGFRYVIIFGEEEKLKNQIKLRDMLKGEQLELSFAEALDILVKERS